MANKSVEDVLRSLEVDVERSKHASIANGLTEDEFIRGIELEKICTENALIVPWETDGEAAAKVEEAFSGLNNLEAKGLRLMFVGSEIPVSAKVRIVDDIKHKMNTLADIEHFGKVLGEDVIDELERMRTLSSDEYFGDDYDIVDQRIDDVLFGDLNKDRLIDILREFARESKMEHRQRGLMVGMKRVDLWHEDIDIPQSRVVSAINGLTEAQFYKGVILDIISEESRDITKGSEGENPFATDYKRMKARGQLQEMFKAGLRFKFKNDEQMSAYERVVKRLKGIGIDVKEIRNRAIFAESRISADMIEIANATGMILDGFASRIKSEEAHMLKVRVQEGRGEKYAGNDEVRYTFLSTTNEGFASAMDDIYRMFQNRAYGKLSFEDFWESADEKYHGATIIAEDPLSKTRFELRFNIGMWARANAIRRRYNDSWRDDFPASGAYLYENIDIECSRRASMQNGLTEYEFDKALTLDKSCIDTLDKAIADTPNKEMFIKKCNKTFTELAQIFNRGLVFVDKDCPDLVMFQDKDNKQEGKNAHS
ncbi:MAG: hypothetical protein LBL41_03930 [Bifidobacteriaceae bacterium]|jgi:hypothetical protein|nr:hypothetical protein [Bifidobacteriaceae bacterium]